LVQTHLLNSGENILVSSVIDTVNKLAYFGTDTSPGIVVKIDLPTFTRLSAVTPGGASEDQFRSAVIDLTNSFAYFGTHNALARVVKIDLPTFTRVGTVTTFGTAPFPASLLDSAVIDPTKGFAYFAQNGTSGVIVKIATTFINPSIPAVQVSGNYVTIQGNTFVPFDQDPTTAALIDIGHPHDDIHEGMEFYVSDLAPNVASGTFLNYVVTTSSKLSHMLFNVIVNAGVIIRVRENPTITSFGIALTTINRHRSSGLTPVTTVFQSGVITSGTGTLLDTEAVGAGGGLGATTFVGGGTTAQDRNENEWVLKISGSYLLQTFTLVSGANVTSQFRWYDATI
jgi:hypothetical protein